MIGLAAGFFSALFGVGGGVVIVPLLLLVARWDLRSATATSLAAVGITVQRLVSTHFYFAAFYTGKGYTEYMAFLNPSAIQAKVNILYQPTTGATKSKSIVVAPHSRFTENVNADLGFHVSAGATISADVPITASAVVYHGSDMAVVLYNVVDGQQPP